MASPTIPEQGRSAALEAVREVLAGAHRVVLSTHVNADGDGAGSETALGHRLRGRGAQVSIVNPTPFPPQFRFLLGDLKAYTPHQIAGRGAIADADVVAVLDTSEPVRLGRVMDYLEERTVVVLDHHPPVGSALGDPVVQDPAACATAELVYDLLALDGTPLSRREAEGLYVAIATDTGSFRYSNTTARTHTITAELLRAGVDPEQMYRRLYGQCTTGRLELLRRALSRLRVHEEQPVASIRLTNADLQETGTTTDDLEEVVEYARRVRGVEVALLFRELQDGRTKVSLRSAGPADVASVARSLGGGGHEKAAGAVLSGNLEAAEREVLNALGKVL